MMKTIWINVVSGWNVIKIFRVLMGIFIVISGISERNTPFIFLGAIFLIFSLITPGVCCAMYNPPAHQNKPVDINDTKYEELGAKQ